MNDKSLNIICPNCKEVISVKDALGHQIKEEISKEAKLQAKRESTEEIRYLEEENKKKEQELEKARKAELEIRREKNSLLEEKKSFEIEKQRQIDIEREQIRQKTLREFFDQQRFKDAEKDKVINDLKKALEEARVKASQGSQQTQGEIPELDLENELRNAFPTDIVEPIKKGEKGADVRQIVKTLKGNTCGVILWESKRTKSWKDEYIKKLKDDLRAEKANVPIIVTEIMPKESKSNLYHKDGVWICNFSLVLTLAELIRQKLIEVAREKFISLNRGSKADDLYEYIMGHEFRQQIEATIEVHLEMKKELEREKRAFESIWKTRDEQINRLLKSTARVIGAVSGKVGSEFPQVKGLELLESGSKEK